MARPDPRRLDPAAYPHQCAIQTRFQDLDVLGHVNNVAFAALFETARTRFNRDADLWTRLRARRTVVAALTINYLAEAHYPDDVTVGSGIGRIGGRSWQILSTMWQNGVPVATCDATLVMTPDEAGGGIPDAFRAALASLALREPPATVS
jgi:acyl-CoA thioester hydrolase